MTVRNGNETGTWTVTGEDLFFVTELISNVLLVHGWRLRMESMPGEKFILCCMKI